MTYKEHQHKAPFGQRLGRVAAIVAVLAVIGALVWRNFEMPDSVQRKQAPQTTVDLLASPPPPPPPPEPPKPTEQPVENDDAPQTPNPEPQAAPITIDGPAQAGGDAFGLQAGSGGGMGAPGGTGDGDGSGMGERFYARYLGSALEQAIQADSRVARRVFAADFAIWVDDKGRLSRAELRKSSGDSQLDQTLSSVLEAIHGLDAPPAGVRFPQRISVAGRRSAG